MDITKVRFAYIVRKLYVNQRNASVGKLYVKILIFGVLILTCATTSALAVASYNTAGMSCARVQAALRSQGTALLRYPSQRTRGLTLYDYYAPDGRRCKKGGVGRRATVPASNTRACPVYRCVKPVTGGGR